jgi:hypothetical protein
LRFELPDWPACVGMAVASGTVDPFKMLIQMDFC